jgi:hypothetical protein
VTDLVYSHRNWKKQVENSLLQVPLHASVVKKAACDVFSCTHLILHGINLIDQCDSKYTTSGDDYLQKIDQYSKSMEGILMYHGIEN